MKRIARIIVPILMGLMANLPALAGPAQRGHAAVVARKNVPAGGGTSPGLTSIIAWYDFADAADADGATYNLSEQNTPTYTAGPPSYGTATDGAPAAHWQQVNLDNNFGAVDGDWSFVIRFRGYTSVANDDSVFRSGGGRYHVIYHTSGIKGLISSTTDTMTSSVAGSLNTWFTVVLTHNTATDTCSMSVNGETFVTDSSMTPSYAVGTSTFGGTTTNTNNIEIDFMGCWNKTLSQDNVTWLYNAGGTRLYSEL